MIEEYAMEIELEREGTKDEGDRTIKKKTLIGRIMIIDGKPVFENDIMSGEYSNVYNKKGKIIGGTNVFGFKTYKVNLHKLK